jgi:transketolase
MVEALVNYEGPVYARIGRNPVPDIYESREYGFKIGKAVTLIDGSDITIITTGEVAKIAVDSALELKKSGIICRVINMHTIKPLDKDIIIKAAEETGHIITIEESSIYGGLGAAVAEVVAQNKPVYMKIIGFPDETVITGNPAQVYDYYGLNVSNITKTAEELLKNKKV